MQLQNDITISSSSEVITIISSNRTDLDIIKINTKLLIGSFPNSEEVTVTAINEINTSSSFNFIKKCTVSRPNNQKTHFKGSRIINITSDTDGITSVGDENGDLIFRKDNDSSFKEGIKYDPESNLIRTTNGCNFDMNSLKGDSFMIKSDSDSTATINITKRCN